MAAVKKTAKKTTTRRAPPAKKKRIESWSYSRFSDYRTCPLKARLKVIDRIKEPQGPALERGSLIHSKAERFIKGVDSKLDDDLKSFAPTLRMLKKRWKENRESVATEQQWGFRRDWSETRWDNWTDCWLRIKLDVAYRIGDVVHVIDWKTGKFRVEKAEEYMEQLELYALTTLLKFPTASRVECRLAFTDAGTWYPDTPAAYSRDDIPRLQREWEKKVQPMLADTSFPPRPNALCRWCHYRAENSKIGGGQCRF